MANPENVTKKLCDECEGNGKILAMCGECNGTGFEINPAASRLADPKVEAVAEPAVPTPAAEAVAAPVDEERTIFEEWWATTIHGTVWNIADERSRMAAKDSSRAAWYASLKTRITPSADALVEALEKSKQLASIGYRIGEADMRGHDKVGERWSKKQDELIAEIDAAIAAYKEAL